MERKKERLGIEEKHIFQVGNVYLQKVSVQVQWEIHMEQTLYLSIRFVFRRDKFLHRTNIHNMEFKKKFIQFRFSIDFCSSTDPHTPLDNPNDSTSRSEQGTFILKLPRFHVAYFNFTRKYLVAVNYIRPEYTQCYIVFTKATDRIHQLKNIYDCTKQNLFFSWFFRSACQ